MGSRASRTAADLAVLGAAVRTLDPERPAAEAVALRDGVVVAVGSDAEVREACDARTELFDGAGVALVPGLTDCHVHPVWGADLTVGADLGGLTTLEQVRAAVAEQARRTPPGQCVRGWGLDYAAFDGPIEGAAVEAAAGGAPVALLFYDLHTMVAGPRALALAGVAGPRAFPDGSQVVCRDGVPTGELREPTAYRLVLDALPAPPAAERRRRVRDVLRRLNAAGLTGAHVMDGGVQTHELLRELEAAGELTVRLVVPLWQRPESPTEDLEDQLPLRDAAGRRWRGGVAKFFIDGVVESGTAWLYAPDAAGGGTAPHWPEPKRYADAVRRFAQTGFQCVTHAVGDRAVRAALDAYRVAGTHGSAPHRIEHLEILADEDLRQVAQDGVVASMQPLHMRWRDGDGSDAFARRLGRERAARAFRTGDLLRAGARLALGSDWPVAPYDPRLGMAWARLRRRPGDPEAPVFEPDQVLTAEQALAGYTTWAARAVGEQAVAGRIAPGRRADLTGFAADPVQVPADDLVDLPVRLAVVDGEVVHTSDGRVG